MRANYVHSVPKWNSALIQYQQADTAVRPAGLATYGVLTALRAYERRFAPVKIE
jgi:hypothetical protein